MAKHSKDIYSSMGDLSINDDVCSSQLKLNDDQRFKLKEIMNNYDSIFSWDIKRLTGISQNLMMDLAGKMREKCEMMHKDDEFDLNRFYSQLIICYELYISGNYNESLMEIESVVKFMESCKYDESNEQYSDAFKHIAQTTNAYIALTLNRNVVNIMMNIKPKNGLNRAERAAICAVKARVFIEYPPKGNDIALKFAEQACNLHSTEPEWIIIWLKAKGRVRRYYEQFGVPDKSEIDAAETLCTTKTKPRLLIQASKLFKEAAYCFKIKDCRNESIKYYKLSSELTLKAIELAKDDIKQLYSCLLVYSDFPKEFNSKSVVENLIQKLSNVKNSRLDQALGKYYLNQEKDYEKAKIHLSRSMASGHFNSSLQLIKVECLLQPIDKYPLVTTLNMIYDVFPSPKRRLIILSQILMYYYYNEYNPKEIMYYLKLYMDQDIDEIFKKRHLIFAVPLFKVNGYFKPKQFLNVLSLKLKTVISSHEWSSQEKEVIDNTFERFNKILKSDLYTNKCFDFGKTGAHKQNNDYFPNKSYAYRKSYDGKLNDNWRKQSNYQQPHTSKDINRNYGQEKYHALNDSPFNQKKKTENGHNQINDSMLSLKDSKLKKFEHKRNSLGNLHVVSVESSSTLTSSNFGTRGRFGNKSNWSQSPRVSPQIYDNHHFQHARGGQQFYTSSQNRYPYRNQKLDNDED